MDALVGLSLDWLVFLFLSFFFIVTFFLWHRYEQRDEKRYRELAVSPLFHCIRCGELFTGRGEVEEADCPACGKKNLRLRF